MFSAIYWIYNLVYEIRAYVSMPAPPTDTCKGGLVNHILDKYYWLMLTRIIMYSIWYTALCSWRSSSSAVFNLNDLDFWCNASFYILVCFFMKADISFFICHSYGEALKTIPGALFLIWINLDFSMDKSHQLWNVMWNYLSIPKFQWCNRWRFRTDK